MAETITVPSNCMGFETADGTKYDAVNNKVTIDNPKHQRDYKKQGYQQILGRSITTLSELPTAENNCTECSYKGWPWQKFCPRCAAYMTNQLPSTLIGEK